MEPLLDVLTVVVEPALRAVFASHELTTVEVWQSKGGFTLRIVAGNETYTDWFIQPDISDTSLDNSRERLRSNLVDFVAESRFAWGQNREAGPPT